MCDKVYKVIRNRKAECPLSPRHTGDRRFISEIVFGSVSEGEKLEESGRFRESFVQEYGRDYVRISVDDFVIHFFTRLD